MISLATLNLLADLHLWERRAPLVLDGFRALQPAVIALQEVSLEPNNAEWLADQLPGYVAHLCPATPDPASDSLAVLTRCPVESHDTLHLGPQGRQAQRVKIVLDDRAWTIINTHLVWNPVSDRIRQAQAVRILDWMQGDERPVLCGDLNAAPRAKSVDLLKARLRSAHQAAHGKEPAFTYPTLLERGPGVRHWARHAALRANGLVRGKNARWGGTVDYILVDPALKVISCSIIFDRPSEADPGIFASDHLGLFAELEDPRYT